ncbi:hypothetical protein VC83_05017 [Pseudogymnoascus destructans]|uniref:MARVEL domain-containing protein n=2 Tax=Pseudogymnoascus destructans TaxID=655981 RepID=L8G0F6_PSED2|nr:uncharacterized protein VC83_05017 [Pseudogymnoascus destructans]ELR06259.1 hypothetical protein GMDG_02053 [Pseudogymnoascus destructans 20631-21]OAF58497.1 hypothetical protein VC83_05017 [Pseudogymnoascus destructans]
MGSSSKPTPLQLRGRTASESSASSSQSALQVPRTPRFAEATAVNSPIDGKGPSPFDDPPEASMSEAKPSDIGFGYIADNTVTRHVEVQVGPASPGLKSAMKVPGTPARKLENPLSPTFREEQFLEKQEEVTDKQQAKDLKVKVRVRAVKLLLRGVNFGCSLIVLALVGTTIHVFMATKHLPARSDLPPWASGTQTWPQYVVLATACVSLFFCVLVFWAYFRGGHRRAEKTAVYYTIFAVGFFLFSIVMWAIAAGILQGTRNNGSGKDIWGWSCVDNKRRQAFNDEIDYQLVCRIQSWAVICCVIEVVVETITIAIYGVIFYRYYSKRQLRKTMDNRDKARSDLYLAQLRTQSAPNTPGFGPLSPSYSTHMKSPRFPSSFAATASDAEEGQGSTAAPGTRFVDASHPGSAAPAKPFALQAPPIKIHAASPKTPPIRAFTPPAPLAETNAGHAPVAPGEQQYASVPIPGAYQPASPGPGQATFGFAEGAPGQAVTSEHRIESPPSSPRLPRQVPRFS